MHMGMAANAQRVVDMPTEASSEMILIEDYAREVSRGTFAKRSYDTDHDVPARFCTVNSDSRGSAYAAVACRSGKSGTLKAANAHAGFVRVWYDNSGTAYRLSRNLAMAATLALPRPKASFFGGCAACAPT